MPCPLQLRKCVLFGTSDPFFKTVFLFFGKVGMKPFCASLTDRLTGHHLLLMGLCRISLAHMQFFEAKFNAFILTTKWFQQLQLREKIRYKLGPRYTYFSSLVKKVKNVWVYFDPRVAFLNVQKQKVLEEIPCYYKVVLPLAISCM